MIAHIVVISPVSIVKRIILERVSSVGSKVAPSLARASYGNVVRLWHLS